MTAAHVLAPVDPCDVFCISGYVLNVSRNRKRLENVFSLDGTLYADVSDVGREAFEPCDVKTYRWTITERQIGGADVETASLREVEWDGAGYTDTGNSL